MTSSNKSEVEVRIAEAKIYCPPKLFQNLSDEHGNAIVCQPLRFGPETRLHITALMGGKMTLKISEDAYTENPALQALLPQLNKDPSITGKQSSVLCHKALFLAEVRPLKEDAVIGWKLFFRGSDLTPEVDLKFHTKEDARKWQGGIWQHKKDVENMRAPGAAPSKITSSSKSKSSLLETGPPVKQRRISPPKPKSTSGSFTIGTDTLHKPQPRVSPALASIPAPSRQYGAAGAYNTPVVPDRTRLYQETAEKNHAALFAKTLQKNGPVSSSNYRRDTSSAALLSSSGPPASLGGCHVPGFVPPPCSGSTTSSTSSSTITGAGGMVNLGNTCFFNAVLQAIRSVVRFVDTLRANRPRGFFDGDGLIRLNGVVEQDGGGTVGPTHVGGQAQAQAHDSSAGATSSGPTSSGPSTTTALPSVPELKPLVNEAPGPLTAKPEVFDLSSQIDVRSQADDSSRAPSPRKGDHKEDNEAKNVDSVPTPIRKRTGKSDSPDLILLDESSSGMEGASSNAGAAAASGTTAAGGVIVGTSAASSSSSTVKKRLSSSTTDAGTTTTAGVAVSSNQPATAFGAATAFSRTSNGTRASAEAPGLQKQQEPLQVYRSTSTTTASTSIVQIYEQSVSLFASLQADSKAANPRELLQSISSKNPMFGNHMQHDAHEFFLEYINQLHDALLHRVEVLPTLLFDSEISLGLECASCKRWKSENVEKFRDYSVDFLPITGVPQSLEAMLQAYFAEESLEYRCPRCHGEEEDTTTAEQTKSFEQDNAVCPAIGAVELGTRSPPPGGHVACSVSGGIEIYPPKDDREDSMSIAGERGDPSSSEVASSKVVALNPSQKMVTVRKAIRQPPHALALHLKRFKPDFIAKRFVKRREEVRWPPELDLTPFLHPDYLAEQEEEQKRKEEKRSRGNAADTSTVLTEAQMASMTEEEMLAWALKQSADQSTDEIDVGNPGDKKADGQNDRALTKKGAQYQLQSIVAHSGDTPHCGHYVTWCRRWETSTWICYNDSTASEHDNLPLSVKTQAYILLYQKKDMKE